ncbi:pectinesterase family protein [Streptomyces blattellae]|uniref:pectinesterase family protein n=1 Tax=Streptomyces blattellae TaxID=2569855 RepID=UPI001E29CADD|nr:pectinesterase family protein [Streptomyces blattellae]
MVLGTAPKASAASGSNHSWKITGEPTDDKKGYFGLINFLRNAVEAGRHQPDPSAPAVRVTDVTAAGTYLSVDLYPEDGGGRFVRVFIHRTDLYVMGFRPGFDGGDALSVDWAPFYPLEPSAMPSDSGTDPAYPLPGSTMQYTDPRFTTARNGGLASYTNLATFGATTENLTISVQSINNAVNQLHRLYAEAENPQITNRLTNGDAAHAILQLIVSIAEATRFREQAENTANAFGLGQGYTLTARDRTFHVNWFRMSAAIIGLTALGVGVALAAPLELGPGIVFATAFALQRALMTAHHTSKDFRGKGLSEEDVDSFCVLPSGLGDHTTIQDAINAAPSDGSAHTIWISEGTYHEVINVPSSRTNLTIQGVTGNASDVRIYNTRCHGMINPETGLKWGTQGSAVASFKPARLTVRSVEIVNTFDPAAHPEINQYETQAVAVLAMGDRQVFDNVRIISTQDTLYVKGPAVTDQARQYFVNCYIRGTIDFIFGHATAVIDRSQIVMLNHVGGTMLAPNTDYRKKYGILVTHCEITNSNVPMNTMHLGRPWHNAPEAWPQAVVRESTVSPHIKADQPWTNMVPEYPWQWARFKEYKNSGLGAGVGENAPKLTDAEALEYTARKYLAGTDGWDPVR